jgi:hypothetical protein
LASCCRGMSRNRSGGLSRSRGHGRSRGASHGGSNNTQSNTNSRSCPQCQVCPKIGHTAATCWYLFDEEYIPEQRTVAAATTSYDCFNNWYTILVQPTISPVNFTSSPCRSATNEDITTSDTTTPSIEMHGPITRSRAQQLRHQVNSFLCSSANDLENRWVSNDLIVIRNQGVDHGGQV